MNNFKRTGNIFVWVILAWILGVAFFGSEKEVQSTDQTYSEFIASVKSNAVKIVTIQGKELTAEYNDGTKGTTYNPGDLGLIGDLIDSGVQINSIRPKKDGFMKQIIISLLPIALIIGALIWMTKKQGGGSGGVFGVGKSKAKMISSESINLSLKDVAGAEEAKEEVKEVVDFLKDPKKYWDLGGQIPKGVLLTGPPGTGKTLIAKAVAGEANVPFFFVSGSDFVEMFVGVGASRVRDMFEQAKKNAPCIIFIDEIDAVGRHRGGGQGGGNDEREQTLNQMLVEMDGFEGTSGVIVMAATNRPDVLDSALLRPGRFDRHVIVSLPDVKGREAILKVHAKKVKACQDVKLDEIARGTPGFSGAELANLINEATLMAAKAGQDKVTMDLMDAAKDKIMMGTERKSMIMDEGEKLMTAYHESGHAIVGLLTPGHDPVYKVSVVPRGRALGITMFLPERDSYSVSLEKLDGQIASLYGGRIAEELIYGRTGVSTGASNDIERASQMARSMVEKWGMSEALGPISYDKSIGESGVPETYVSGKTSELIDTEVRKIVDRNYSNAKKILVDNMSILKNMTDALMKFETIDQHQIKELISGTKLV
jgi:cell division protease FtsH